MKRTLLAAAILLIAHAANAQIQWDHVAKVDNSDPAVPALKHWKEDLAGRYRKDAQPMFSPWGGLPCPSLKTLFPQYRFFVISWSERPLPGKEKERVSLAYGLESTVVCDRAGKLVKTLHHTGNYQEFAQLLNASQVSIRTANDAKLVWDAFCDVHQLHWQELPALKIDDRTWHLGDSINESSHYYYDVKLDSELRVQTAQLHADRFRPPK